MTMIHGQHQFVFIPIGSIIKGKCIFSKNFFTRAQNSKISIGNIGIEAMYVGPYQGYESKTNTKKRNLEERK